MGNGRHNKTLRQGHCQAKIDIRPNMDLFLLMVELRMGKSTTLRATALMRKSFREGLMPNLFSNSGRMFFLRFRSESMQTSLK
jgi:hypothetical protein